MYNEMCPSNATQYVVKSGDTLWKLSQTYGVSLQSIIDANPGVNADNLQIGSTLCVPSARNPSSSSNTCPDSTFAYIVRSGDTLWKLAQRYNTSVERILDLNPGVDPQNLQIGSTLCIPSQPTPSAPPPAATVTCPEGASPYTIREGDTLWKLSQTYGISVQSILNINQGVDPQNLQIGSTLCIPSQPTPSAPPVPPKPPTPPTPPVTCPTGAFPYTIRQGDTFWKLSQTYGVSLQSILDLNQGVDPQNLQVGSTVCLPNQPTPPAPTIPQTPPTSPAPPTTPTPPTTPVPPTPPTPPTPPRQPSPVPQTPPPACPKGTFSYTVREGDTLWKLSQTYGVSVQSILDLNPQNLPIGATLCIPTASTPPMSASSLGDFSYLVKNGDSIRRIARRFCVSAESILRKNPGINPRNLQAGTYIYVPINRCGVNACRYSVRAGDTLNRIANRFNVNPLDLMAANPNVDFQHLVRCQTICIPIM